MAVCLAQSSSTRARYGTDLPLTALSRCFLIVTTLIHGMRTILRHKGQIMQMRFKYLVEDVDRHSNIRLYVRVPGRRKVRLRSKFGTDEFLAAYTTAVDGHLQAPR